MYKIAKNISARQLAIASTIAIIIMHSALLWVCKVPFNTFTIAGIVLTTIIVFAIIFFCLDYFFQRKIKILYKLISNTKASYREEAMHDAVRHHITMDNVSNDVLKWAAQHSTELEQLKQSEQYRKEFLMNFGHEIKTPVFTVQGYLQTLADGALHDDKVNTSFIQKAQKGIDRLAIMVQQIDTIAKLESGNLVLHKTKFCIQELVQDVFDEFALNASQKNITLGIKEGCEGKIDVVADKDKLKQVLVNLVSNAIAYNREGTQVSAGIYAIDGNNGLVEISDNGIGISEEHVSRVFERFYRAEESRLQHKSGSGLGLAIAKHIVEAHGQDIHCRSTINVGSTFGFGVELG